MNTSLRSKRSSNVNRNADTLVRGQAYLGDHQRWNAVLHRDRKADGKFFYSVSTTGIYCRPWCAARLARREHVAFHSSSADAEKAGFRPCKRCQPNGLALEEQY